MDFTEEEFEKIILNNKDRLNHLCRAYVQDREERKDLYQDILIQIWRSLPSFDGRAEIDTWLYRVAVNTAISHIRKRSTRRDYHSVFRREKKSDRKNARLQPDGNEKLEKIYKAISKLNAADKAIITMYLDDFSYAEIAFVTNISENYVGVKLNRIRKKLSQIIGV